MAKTRRTTISASEEDLGTLAGEAARRGLPR